jgi:hypothetical protein
LHIRTIRAERLDAATQAMARAAQAMADAAARWDRRLHDIKRLAEAQASTAPVTAQMPPAEQQ